MCLRNKILKIFLVGYGDYYPLSVLGRFIIIITSLAGIILVSFVIIFLQNSTNLSESEVKVKLIKNLWKFIKKIEFFKISKFIQNLFKNYISFIIYFRPLNLWTDLRLRKIWKRILLLISIKISNITYKNWNIWSLSKVKKRKIMLK